MAQILLLGITHMCCKGLSGTAEFQSLTVLEIFFFDNALPHVTERNFSRIEMGRYAQHEVRRDPEKFSRGAVLTVGISGST